ncbi:hypothetical protein ES703_00073 [subsurface metagenome]
MKMPPIPAALQRNILERWAADLARKLDPPVDPTLALEAVDYAFDSTLTYSENKTAVEEELAHRGIFGEAPSPETPEWARVEELPPYRPPEALKKELEEVKSERERLVRELRKIKSKFERFKELSEEEKLRLAAEARDLEESLKTVVGEIPPEYLDELKAVFLKLKDATEEKFWDWYGMYRDEVKEKHKVAVAATFEGSMHDFLVGKPKPAPPKPVVPEKPKPKFEVGEKAFHPDLKEVTIRAQRWNELLRRWDYVVESRRKTALVSEAELIKLPPLPPAPPKPPRVPRVPRVPVAPPRPIEEIAVSPITGKPLERVIHVRVITPEISQEPIPWPEMTEEQRRRYEFKNQVPTREVTIERIEMVEVPSGMLFFFDRADGRYYEVVDYTLMPISYDKIIERVRRVLRPIIPRRGPAAPLSILREAQLHVREVETDPEFQKYVLEEVGLEWATYLRQDAWTKKAIRDEFIKAKGPM